MWWLRRVNFSISKYLCSRYWRVQMKWMYLRRCMGCMYQRYVSRCYFRSCTSCCVHQIPIPWKCLLWCTKFGRIMVCYSGVNQIGLIQVDVIWIGVIQVGVDVIHIDVNIDFRIFAPNFSTPKLFSHPAFFF